MVLDKDQRIFIINEYNKTKSVITVQRNFETKFKIKAPVKS